MLGKRNKQEEDDGPCSRNQRQTERHISVRLVKTRYCLMLVKKGFKVIIKPRESVLFTIVFLSCNYSFSSRKAQKYLKTSEFMEFSACQLFSSIGVIRLKISLLVTKISVVVLWSSNSTSGVYGLFLNF